MNYTDACAKAKRISLDQQCTQHVDANVIVSRHENIEPMIDSTGYLLSDWHTPVTVATYYMGRRSSYA